MILEYHRPQTIDEAVRLLSRSTPVTIPLAGGSTIQRQGKDIAVVDLQNLDLNRIEITNNAASLGSMVTFQQLMEWEDAPGVLVEAAHRGANYNVRNQATLGGAIASTTDHSPIVAALLAMDSRITWQPGDVTLFLGEWLPTRALEKVGDLITSVSIQTNLVTAMEIIAKTPGDVPQILACGCKWPSGRIRIVTMVKGHAPVLMSDGRDVVGMQLSSMNIDHQSTSFSDEYLKRSINILIGRVINRLHE
jgi:hypothetical protein